MGKTLWDYYDGEPFMENPQLGLLTLNTPKPGRRHSRKRGKKMAVRKRRRTHRRKMTALQRKYFGKRKSSPKRRRRSRKNPWAVPGVVVAANPRRKRSRGRRHSPKRHRRRRSNPLSLGGLFSMPPVKSIAFAGIGFAGPSLVSGFLMQTFPTVMQQTTSMGIVGKYVVKIGSVIGLTWLVKRFIGTNESHMVQIGGWANVGLTAVNDFAPGFLPPNPLSMYLPVRGGMRAYQPTRPGMRALPSAEVSALNRGSEIPSAAPFRSFSKFGVAQRYFRY